MRFLNKIIFINSASIKYAEMQLGGNVHLIGTQGVGKSTLLRAVLFFYNADAQKLGIKPGQKSFYDYYFPAPDSYIIYEVVKETGVYSVLCYRYMNKICYRFFDSEYKQQLFISEQNKAYESWEQIKEQLVKHRIAASGRVDRYDDYRDILYGNNEGKKEFRKYALLESKQYQNIPRTIQNVLLNAELKAEFIKQTIIKSLNDDDIEIDLNRIKHHLNLLNLQLLDIRKWSDANKNGEIPLRKLANEISKLHQNIKRSERELQHTALYLAHSIDLIHRQKPEIEAQLSVDEQQKKTILDRIKQLERDFQEKRDAITAEIAVKVSEIAKSNERIAYYKAQNIDAILEQAKQKPNLLAKRENLATEKRILSTQFEELTSKFEALLSELDNQTQRFINLKQTEKNTAQTHFLTNKDDINTLYTKHIEQIRNDNSKKIELLGTEIEQIHAQIIEHQHKKAHITHSKYFDTEIMQAKSDLLSLQNDKTSGEQYITHAKEQIKTLQAQFEFELKTKQKDCDAAIEKLQNQIVGLNNQIKEIDFKLDNSKSSLYGWLNDNYEGWEQNIGKVIAHTDGVLFNSSLHPRLIGSKTSLYGVELQLDEIENQVKSLSDYEHEKANYLSKIESLTNEIAQARTTHETEVEKLRSKYQPKIKEFKKEIDNQTYQLDQNQTKQNQAKLTILDFERKAKEQKDNELANIEQEIAKSTAAEKLIKSNLLDIKQQIKELEKAKVAEKEQKIATAQLQFAEIERNITEELRLAEIDFANKKADIKQKQFSELQSKGVDTKRIELIEEELIKLNSDLQAIENLTETINIYNYEKKEFIDKLDYFKNQKELLDKQLFAEEIGHKQLKEKEQNQLDAIEQILKKASNQLAKFESDLSEFESFKNSHVYQSIGDEFKIASSAWQSTKSPRELITNLQLLSMQYVKDISSIKDAILQFTGFFSVDNIFKFSISFTETSDYMQFAEDLHEFVEENKIARFEKDVTENFAYIIQLIGKESSNLMSRASVIQRTITKINNDFDQKNFVGAIKKIELKSVESSNDIVKYLIEIERFNNENQFVGTNNLFASQDIDSQNKQAVDLMSVLLKAIGESKREKINLSDTFELEFRVLENQNDTGWVNKLANVGSDGTDILVKAMINIMLLNVSKGESSKQFKDFKLHCMMDEIGKLHSNNVKGILRFANERNILLINGSPEENNALGYKHIYHLYKDEKSFTKVKRLITNNNQL